MRLGSSSSDVVIVGAGIIGLAIAWRTAQQGLAVTVIDPEPMSGATRVAAGMLAPVTEVHYGEERLLRLTLDAAARYPQFVAELAEAGGEPVGYRRCGTLTVALDSGDRAVLDDLRRFQRGLGLDAEGLTGRECRRLEPMLSPSVQGGVLATGDHQVDPRRLASALYTVVQAQKVTVRRSRAVEVVVDGDAVTGVQLDDGSKLAAGTVVLAAGSRTGEVGGVPAAARPPVRPVKGQILRLRMPTRHPLLDRTIRGVVRGSAVSLVPRADGELVVGATQEEQGFDEQVTAGSVYQLLRDAHDLVPGITELPLVETSAGLRPGTPDNAPIVGPTGLAGLVMATGHYRNGVLLAPVTAEAVATLLATGTLPELMTPFTLARLTPTTYEEAALG